MKEIDVKDLKQFNPFTCCNDDWFIVSAEKEGQINALTASWGGFGRCWNKNVATLYIRPHRYTREFIDSQDAFTISFLKKGYKEALQFLGTHSGKDMPNKIEKAGLHECFIGSVHTFREASLVLFCKLLYKQALDPSCMIENQINHDFYPNQDHSLIYLGEILNIYSD